MRSLLMLTRGVGGFKIGQNELTSYVNAPLVSLQTLNYVQQIKKYILAAVTLKNILIINNFLSKWCIANSNLATAEKVISLSIVNDTCKCDFVRLCSILNSDPSIVFVFFLLHSAWG